MRRWPMNIALAGVAALVASVLVVMQWGNRRRAKALPDIADESFLQTYRDRFETADDAVVLKERNYIAKLLGIPAQKLTPQQAFKELEGHASLSYDVALGDLASDIDNAYKNTGLRAPSVFPATVGEAIDALVRARRASRQAS